MENKSETSGKIVIDHSIEVIGPIIENGVVKANRDGYLPDPVAFWPHPENLKGATIVIFPEGFDVETFAEKIRREAGLTKTASI